MNKKSVASLIFVFSFVITPFFVSASLTGDIDPLASTNTCNNLTYDLRLTSRDTQTGGQVSDLQFVLQTKGYLNSEPTGYFGLLTQAAVKGYQNANGIIPASGFVGPITRGKINAECTLGTNIATTNTTSISNVSNISITSGCKSGAVFSSVTGRPCKTEDTSHGDGCSTGSAFSSVTGRLCKTQDTSYEDGCSAGIVFSSVTGRPCKMEVTQELPRVRMVRGMAADDFEIDSEGKVEITGSNLISSGNDAKVFIGGRQAGVIQFGENLLFASSPELTKGSSYDLYVMTSAGKSNVVEVKIIGVAGVIPGCSSGVRFSATTGQTCLTTNTSTVEQTPTVISEKVSITSENLGVDYGNGYENYSINLNRDSSSSITMWKIYYTCTNTALSVQNNSVDCASSFPQQIWTDNYNLSIKKPTSGTASLRIRAVALSSSGAVLGEAFNTITFNAAAEGVIPTLREGCTSQSGYSSVDGSSCL